MIFLDPICFRLCFSCITSQINEPYIKIVYQNLVSGLKPIVLPFLKTGFLKPVMWSEGDQGYLGTVKWVPSALNGADVTENYYDYLLEKLQKNDLHGFMLSCTPENDLKKYGQKQTKYAKNYMKLFTKLDECRLSNSLSPESRRMIQDLFDCPDENLSDISVPIHHLRNSMPFEVSLYTITCKESKFNKTHYIFRADNSDLMASSFLHQLNLVIPRFLLGRQDSTYAFQSSWMEAIKQLGEHYSISFGTIGLDAPPEHYVYHGNTCYDDSSIRMLSKRYFDQYISGYSWCTLLNARQFALISHQVNAISQLTLATLANGNAILTLNGNINSTTHEEAQIIRSIFKPYLPPVPITFPAGGIPPSFRLGFSIDEIEYVGNDLYSFQII